MFTHPQQGLPADEVLRLRQAAGAYIRKHREAAKFSQRSFAAEVGTYYTFVSQVESGRGRVPPLQMADWARVLNIPPREFAIEMMRFYDPLTFKMIFTEENLKRLLADTASSELSDAISGIQARLERIENFLSNKS